MMRKSLFLALLPLLAGFAHGVTVSWYIPHASPDYAWTEQLDSVAILSSTTEFKSDKEFLSAYKGGSVQVDAVRHVNNPSASTTNFTISKLHDRVDFTGAQLDPNRWYFIVVSNGGDNPEYAVSKAHQYIPTSTERPGDPSKGFYYDTIAKPEQRPDRATYVDLPGVLGGTWTAAMTPEPTVLALLALGVAGLALRRKSVID